MTKILLTGGGTAGHVMPNVALLPFLTDFEIHYVGRGGDAIEKKLISEFPNVHYYEIHAGKLRRYISFKNLLDFFRFLLGIVESWFILKKVKPDIIFSKGGYVSVPVVLAANNKKTPIITHESDITPGLANKIITKRATKILTTFPETVKYLPEDKAIYVGSPVRQSLLSGNRETGLSFMGFGGEKPILLVMGGSMGAKKVNGAIRENLDFLKEKFDVCHICGKGNEVEGLDDKSYKQFEFIGNELRDVLAATDFVVTRGGSNAICEFAALKKPMLIIPLGMKSSRGDQILNANKFVEDGLAISIAEEDITKESFEESINTLVAKKDEMTRNLENAHYENGTEKVFEIILKTEKPKNRRTEKH